MEMTMGKAILRLTQIEHHKTVMSILILLLVSTVCPFQGNVLGSFCGRCHHLCRSQQTGSSRGDQNSQHHATARYKTVDDCMVEQCN